MIFVNIPYIMLLKHFATSLKFQLSIFPNKFFTNINQSRILCLFIYVKANIIQTNIVFFFGQNIYTVKSNQILLGNKFECHHMHPFRPFIKQK